MIDNNWMAMTSCYRCGKGVGIVMHKRMKDFAIYECAKCGANHMGPPAPERCVKCLEVRFVKRPLARNESIPCELCDDCQKEIREHQQIVADGGVYFRCLQCKAEGVIKPNEFTKHVRESQGIFPPHPLGIEFVSCEQHTPLKENNSEEEEQS